MSQNSKAPQRQGLVHIGAGLVCCVQQSVRWVAVGLDRC